tara:strand:+ start:409 stop:972 length:564 start_codon:yes stop_codon:yes gene_type:complete
MNRFAFSRGFTIVELLVTIAIAAILLAVAVPSFTLFAQKRAISQKTVQVRNALELARGLALSQRQVWAVCTVDASNSCVSSAGLRLLVFRDDNDDKDFNTGEMLHQDIDINSIALQVSASFSRPYVRFARSGEALETGNIEVCSVNQTVDYGRRVIFIGSGRIRLSNDSDGDGYDDFNGSKIDCPSS